jgi:hypothetical protein
MYRAMFSDKTTRDAAKPDSDTGHDYFKGVTSQNE